ncbi:unnamed protein product, partial [Ranitomeya imitator]
FSRVGSDFPGFPSWTDARYPLIDSLLGTLLLFLLFSRLGAAKQEPCLTCRKPGQQFHQESLLKARGYAIF